MHVYIDKPRQHQTAAAVQHLIRRKRILLPGIHIINPSILHIYISRHKAFQVGIVNFRILYE